MTIIAAVKKNNEVWMVADSLITFNTIQRSDRIDRTKLIFLKNAVIGVSGIVLPGDIIQYWVDRARVPKDTKLGGKFRTLYEWPFDTTASVHEFFKHFYKYLNDNYNLGYALTAPSSEELKKNDFMLCTDSHIYHISSSRCVVEHDNYDAIGSGHVEMLSAMDALFPIVKAPDEILKRAFDTTCKFDWGSGGPMNLVNVSKMLTVKPKKNAIPKNAVKKPPRKK